MEKANPRVGVTLTSEVTAEALIRALYVEFNELRLDLDQVEAIFEAVRDDSNAWAAIAARSEHCTWPL